MSPSFAQSPWGEDRLVGNADDDILIAGFTSYDNDCRALAAVMAEWTSARSFSQRVYNLSGGSVSAGNGSTFANRANFDAEGRFYELRSDGLLATVFDDNEYDVLTGSSGYDWFMFNADGENGTKKDKATDIGTFEQLYSLDLDWINMGV